MTRDEILAFLHEHRDDMARRFGVISMGLFGSFARNEATEESDIDIVVEIKNTNKFMNFFDLKYYLEKHLNHPVDLGIESTLKPAAKESVRRDIIYV